MNAETRKLRDKANLKIKNEYKNKLYLKIERPNRNLELRLMGCRTNSETVGV